MRHRKCMGDNCQRYKVTRDMWCCVSCVVGADHSAACNKAQLNEVPLWWCGTCGDSGMIEVYDYRDPGSDAILGYRSCGPNCMARYPGRMWKLPDDWWSKRPPREIWIDHPSEIKKEEEAPF